MEIEDAQSLADVLAGEVAQVMVIHSSHQGNIELSVAKAITHHLK